jgi:glyoxylase I family protein
MARLTRIQHEGIPVKDLDRSRAFYEGVLGLKTLPRPAFGPGVWLADASGVPQIHLIVSQAAVPGVDARPDATARHTAFLVEDYDGLKQRFEQGGVRYTEAPNSPAGVAQLTAVDPDGHVLEFQPADHYGDAIYTPGFEPRED